MVLGINLIAKFRHQNCGGFAIADKFTQPERISLDGSPVRFRSFGRAGIPRIRRPQQVRPADIAGSIRSRQIAHNRRQPERRGSILLP